MPIYEYQCQNCGETTEIMQKFSDPPLRKCPLCGRRVTKLMSMNSFALKGGGWYVTDYAKGQAKGGAKAASSSEPAPAKEAAPAAAGTAGATPAKEPKKEPRPAQEARA